MADVRLTATNPEDSSVVPVACDASGRLLLQELPAIDTIEGDLYVTGKGTFAGGKSIIGNDGSAQFAQGAVDIYANGQVEFTQNVNFDGTITAGNPSSASGGTEVSSSGVYIRSADSYDKALEIYDQGFSAGDATITLWSEGNATFAGDVDVSLNNFDLNNAGSIGCRMGPGGQVIAKRNEKNSSAKVFSGVGGAYPADETSAIYSDGSAAFAGIVKGGGDYASGSGVGLTSWGECIARNDGLSPVPAFSAYRGGVGAGNVKARIYNDGSVAFAGNKAGFTSEGYLWCTTRRGDTVILDATSNGLASWVEYTPTSRIDEIRDNLDANRPGISEMPADTQ